MQSDENLPVFASNDAPEPESQDDRMNRLRATYATAFSDIMDRVLQELILGDDKRAVLTDAAQFFVFIMSAKIAEVNFAPGDRQTMLTAFWQLQAGIKQEVPGMLRQFADDYAKGRRP